MALSQNTQPPKSATKTFKEIRSIIEKGWIEMPTGSSFGGTGAPGRLLEQLLGISENNRDSPDFDDWEIKFHGGNSLLTLFHKSPQPRGIMSHLVHEFGKPNENDQLTLRHTFTGTEPSPLGFYVVNENERLIVRNSLKDTVVSYWHHSTILSGATAKLRRLILLEGDYKKTERKIIYAKGTAYWDFKVLDFCKLIEQGKVFIDFDARTKNGRGSTLRDHGTKFRVNVSDLNNLYEHRREIN